MHSSSFLRLMRSFKGLILLGNSCLSDWVVLWLGKGQLSAILLCVSLRKVFSCELGISPFLQATESFLRNVARVNEETLTDFSLLVRGGAPSGRELFGLLQSKLPLVSFEHSRNQTLGQSTRWFGRRKRNEGGRNARERRGEKRNIESKKDVEDAHLDVRGFHSS